MGIDMKKRTAIVLRHNWAENAKMGSLKKCVECVRRKHIGTHMQ